MEKKITRQETVYLCESTCMISDPKRRNCGRCKDRNTETTMYFNDGSSMPIEEYRVLHGLPAKAEPAEQKPPVYSDEEMKIRKPIISEIIKFDLSAGLKYSTSGGFVRDKNGKYIFDEKTARDTLAFFSTAELQKIASGMPTLAKKND